MGSISLQGRELSHQSGEVASNVSGNVFGVGAGGVRSVRERSVVRAFLLRPPRPNKPASRISLATRFLAHLTPSILSSKWILGAP